MTMNRYLVFIAYHWWPAYFRQYVVWCYQLSFSCSSEPNTSITDCGEIKPGRWSSLSSFLLVLPWLPLSVWQYSCYPTTLCPAERSVITILEPITFLLSCCPSQSSVLACILCGDVLKKLHPRLLLLFRGHQWFPPKWPKKTAIQLLDKINLNISSYVPRELHTLFIQIIRLQPIVRTRLSGRPTSNIFNPHRCNNPTLRNMKKGWMLCLLFLGCNFWTYGPLMSCGYVIIY